jgi:enoyl-CoA hydratase/carnithine racemase
MTQAVVYEKRGSASWITISREEKRNALNGEVIAGVADGVRRAHADPSVRAIVVTGAGEKAFCAGADLQPGQGFAFELSRPNLAYADLIREAASATLPMIARVNGACLAGGMGLLCMTDLAVAASDVMFGLPEVKVGVFPMQVIALMQDLVPRRMLREWCLTGEPFEADAALAAGLVNYVVPRAELDLKTEWLIARLGDKSPTAIRRGKYAMRAMASMSFEAALAHAEAQMAVMPLTEDAKEGLAAFSEKRAPSFTGR